MLALVVASLVLMIAGDDICNLPHSEWLPDLPGACAAPQTTVFSLFPFALSGRESGTMANISVVPSDTSYTRWRYSARVFIRKPPASWASIMHTIRAHEFMTPTIFLTPAWSLVFQVGSTAEDHLHALTVACLDIVSGWNSTAAHG